MPRKCHERNPYKYGIVFLGGGCDCRAGTHSVGLGLFGQEDGMEGGGNSHLVVALVVNQKWTV